MAMPLGQWNTGGHDNGPVLYLRITWHCVLPLACLGASDLSQKNMLLVVAVTFSLGHRTYLTLT